MKYLTKEYEKKPRISQVKHDTHLNALFLHILKEFDRSPHNEITKQKEKIQQSNVMWTFNSTDTKLDFYCTKF